MCAESDTEDLARAPSPKSSQREGFFPKGSKLIKRFCYLCLPIKRKYKLQYKCVKFITLSIILF